MYTYHGVPEGSMIYFISPIFRLVLVLVRCFPGNAWAEGLPGDSTRDTVRA